MDGRCIITHLAFENCDACLEGVCRCQGGAQSACSASGNRCDWQIDAAVACAAMQHGLSDLQHTPISSAHDTHVEFFKILSHDNLVPIQATPFNTQKWLQSWEKLGSQVICVGAFSHVTRHTRSCEEMRDAAPQNERIKSILNGIFGLFCTREWAV